MGLIVQKFGGTSVADAERIRKAAQRLVEAKLAGNRVIGVVSAMGRSTDELITLARQVNRDPPRREMDMLLATGEQVSIALISMAIHALGHDVVSLTGPQAGITTDSVHGKARIQRIESDRLNHELDQGHIVIVAGFQGIDDNLNITTLGRGGSDTTAVALAAALGADLCEIYTDVEGVYTADPRIVPDARKLDVISHDEMLELASLGAGVLQPRCVEFAKKFSVPLRVRSSFSDDPGTEVSEEVLGMEEVVVRGAALNRDEAKVSILGVPDQPGVALTILQKMADANVNVDMIVQNVSRDARADMTFTVPKDELKEALRALKKLVPTLGADKVIADARIAKISIVGVGMRSHTGVAAKMFSALAKAGVNMQLISTSEIKISCVVDDASAEQGLRAVHEAFELEKPETTAPK